MIDRLTLPEIRELIVDGDVATLDDVLNSWLPADLATILEALSPAEQTVVVGSLRTHVAANVAEYMSLTRQEQLFATLPQPQVADIVNYMAPDDRTVVLESVSPKLAERLLGLLTPNNRQVAVGLLKFLPGTVGRLMTPDFIDVHEDWSVSQVLDYVRAHGRDSETLNVIYVTNPQGKLIDDIRIREFLLAPVDLHVRDIMDRQFVTLSTSDSKESAVDVFRKYDRTALPVVDEQGTLVGLVTIDDVLDIAEQQATRELQKFGGLEALDEPYVATALLAMVRKRASWLVVLFLGEMLTATAMGFFQGEIEKAVVLALFVPLIISSGGNSGSQAATLIVRALALGEIRLRDWLMVLRREVLSGLMLGVILGTIGFLRIAVWSGFSDIYGPHWGLVALTVGFSLVGIVLWGSVSGSMMPFILKRFGLDPATSSAPFVATLVDVTGLVIYFTVAFVLLHGTLL